MRGVFSLKKGKKECGVTGIFTGFLGEPTVPLRTPDANPSLYGEGGEAQGAPGGNLGFPRDDQWGI